MKKINCHLRFYAQWEIEDYNKYAFKTNEDSYVKDIKKGPAIPYIGCDRLFFD